MGYMQGLRWLVGIHPLIMVGATLLTSDQNNRLLFIRRTDNNKPAHQAHFSGFGEQDRKKTPQLSFVVNCLEDARSGCPGSRQRGRHL